LRLLKCVAGGQFIALQSRSVIRRRRMSLTRVTPTHTHQASLYSLPPSQSSTWRTASHDLVIADMIFTPDAIISSPSMCMYVYLSVFLSVCLCVCDDAMSTAERQVEVDVTTYFLLVARDYTNVSHVAGHVTAGPSLQLHLAHFARLAVTGARITRK